MSLNTAALHIAGNALAGQILGMQIHTGDPGAAGTSNTTSAARQACAFSDTNGTISLTSPVAFSGGAASGAATYVSLWTSATPGAGTYLGQYALTGDQTFNAAGQYTVETLTLTGSAS